jgi:chemotaxis protein methyltransferase CheR
VLATDLSTKALARAASGRYTQLEVNRGLPAALLVKYFERRGREWQIRADVQQMVFFRQLNLTKAVSGVSPMDVIFLRNVLVYFEADAKAEVLGRLAEVLRPGGYLFLGGTETTCATDNRYTQVQFGQSICYRRVDQRERKK